MKEQFTTSVLVKGKGDTRGKAFADALSRVQQQVLQSTNKILLRIEPQDVKVIRAQQSVKKEKFLFFFLARERRNYSVELEITVNVTVIDTDKVEFTVAQ
ncbi:MAG: DUF4312 family protein [Mixta calida]|jgi:uncharacterized protein (TIGR03578 family)|uniref:Cytoplasmic protein n=1 Tax=Mixta calida TaxID=665913 RepID=A0ABM6S5P0_9GAMM|nr:MULTISPECIES: DUF4312 family protein [Mixta]AIX72438.1 cytoplasmic protein [Pantoea sp. PSNIH2]MBS6057379.1 DUF4312 family protein [Pantoea sp.]POU47517.1 cytoplasmic protein [Pantoea sp. PSNIH5]POU66132.1 cytoplasmic protein [Pantoea sp. PSNIH4]POY68008.1 cytoplasmic protein [Pantoea sp. PSNIH3]HCV75153.1 DUF4312 domain-containing protein [Pseudomonas sp.]